MKVESLTLPDRIRHSLQRLENSKPLQAWQNRRQHLKDRSLTRAAVLIPITEIDGEMHILFTKRSSDLREHSGEISFPGGRFDPGDKSLLGAALREAREEVSLHPDDVHIYGALTQIPVLTGYEVTSFVGEFRSPYDLYFNPDEIAEGFLAPVSHLIQAQNYRLEYREYHGVVYPLHFFEYDNHIIWGATGFMLHSFFDFLGMTSYSTVETSTDK